MKVKIFLIALTVSICTGLHAGQINDSVSYALGIQIANSLDKDGILNEIDFNTLIEAFNDVKSDSPKLAEEQVVQVLRNYLTTFAEKKRKENENLGKDFLEKNAKEKDVVVLPSGLQYKILEKGRLRTPTLTDTVEVHYKGLLVTGREFESSAKMAGSPVRFLLGDVIPGWKEGLQYVAEGGKIMLYIPPRLAYGDRSMQGSPIPPSSTLIFEIELIKIISTNLNITQ
jgi:FKBP-type peptidyl-prolyl cis-trans isomerase